MDPGLIEKIKQCPKLPSLPALAIQVLDLAQRDEVDIAEIARIITQDPALSSKILRTANSSFYARSQTISTMNHALVVLGLQSVKTLVLGFSLVTNLSKTGSRGFKHLEYWRRSIYSATAARCLAAKLRIVQAEECFLAALLKDIGMLVLDQVIGEPYGRLFEQVTTHRQLPEVEQAALSTTHAEVSGFMAQEWHLPPVLAVPMAWHHCPAGAPETDPGLKRLAELVALSDRCADVFVEPDAAPVIADVRRLCQESFQIDQAGCDSMMEEIGTRTGEVAPLFEVSIGHYASYEDILNRANETLVSLTLRTQQQAASLKEKNQELQQAATTDPLTGLANRTAFDRFAAEHFMRAASAGQPLSILMIDVDRFKSINDSRGHQIGDQVLASLGRLLKGTARAEDLAARYGGEEFSLVLPATGRSTAAAIAESLRRAVCAKPIAAEGGAVTVSISVGVATAEPGGPFTHLSQALKAADLAMYAAKRSGRNRVKVFALKPQAA